MAKSGESAGVVLRIEKSSIHDGDGLRTVVFLKGCPLRCLWCSTPESQKTAPERGLSREKCVLCGRCVQNCPNGALSRAGDKIVFDRGKCSGCFKCADVCPTSAVVKYGEKMTAVAVVKEIAKDEIFYFHSGGGVTVSGGEPLEQSEFVLDILAGCAARGIDCALETSFFAPWEKIEPLLPYISLLHVDIKETDARKHRELTGVDNKIILDNIKRADNFRGSFQIVARTPLVPGINDGDDEIIGLARFAGGLKKLRHMEFLAYHRLGTETYRRLEIKYALPDIAPPSWEYMKERALLFKAHSQVPVKVNNIAVG